MNKMRALRQTQITFIVSFSPDINYSEKSEDNFSDVSRLKFGHDSTHVWITS